MNTKSFLSTVLIAVALFATFAGSGNAAEIRWGKSLAAAEKSSRKNGKLIMVDMFTDWCGYCRKLDADTYRDPSIVRLSGRFETVKLNAETQAEGVALAKKYQVTGYPTILFLDAKGHIFKRIGGYAPAAPFGKMMQEALSLHRDLPILESRAHSHPGDGKMAADLCVAYARIDNANGALNQLALVEKIGNVPNEALNNARTNTAVVLAQRGNFKEALPIFQRVTRSAKSTEQIAMSHFNAGLCYAGLGNKSASASELKAAQAISGTPPEFKDRVSQVLASVSR